MTRFCPRCGDRNRGYAIALPFLPVWSTCEGCSEFHFRSFFQAVRRFALRVLGRPEPPPVNAGVTILPSEPVELFEFLAPSTPEALPTDVVDEWLESQDCGQADDRHDPAPAKRSHREPKPSRERTTSEEELHLFFGDEDAVAPDERAKALQSGKEWPVDALLSDEWSVSRLVH